MDYKNIAAAVIGGVLVLVIGFVMLGIGQDGRDGRDGRNGRDGTVGAIPGDTVDSNKFTIGGVTRYYESQRSLYQGTSSVVCSLKSPSATSTLVSGMLHITDGTTTAASYAGGKSTVRFTLQDIISSTSVAANLGGTYYLSSTTYSADGSVEKEFSPNEYVIWQVDPSGPGNTNLQGNCTAIWDVWTDAV